MTTNLKNNLSDFDDSTIYEEAARRLQFLVESIVGKKFTFGEAVFVFHNGRFLRIDCQPSLRAYLKSNGVEAHL